MQQRDTDKRTIIINDPGGGVEFMHIHEDDVCCCLRASMGPNNAPIVMIYDSRGNGGGVSPPLSRETIKTG